MGRKTKIGVLIFTDQIKERQLSKSYFDGKKYFGFRHIISELKNCSLKYISSIESELNSVDFVLVSLTSYYDILNLINELRGKKIKSKIIVGGAGLLNFSLLKKYIDVAVIGRGEGIINQIFSEQEFDNVWYKSKDMNIEKKYKVGSAKVLIKNGKFEENSVGCTKRCYFCQYGWKNTLYCGQENYKSGFNKFEDTIENVDWMQKGVGYLVTAIDGMSEKSRKIVNKNITDIDIEKKFEEFFSYKIEKKSIKVYTIVGYPWELDIDLSLPDIIKKVDIKSKSILNIFLIPTHFVPMPLTPMESDSVNTYSFRNELIKRKITYLNGSSIKFFWLGNQCTSPVSAMEECILYRSKVDDLGLVEKIFLSSRYKNLKSYQKIKAIKEFFPRELWGEKEGKVLDYIEYPKGFDAAQKRYYRLKKELL